MNIEDEILANHPDDTYKMTVDLHVLNHLGINLYSNIAAVLTEAIANSWDADATEVNINFDPESTWIEIVDNGIGMTLNDLNEKYLRVGYQRRETVANGGRTPLGRNVMGRKGLGKLSLFSIADEIEIQSAKDGERHGLSMDINDIQQSVSSNAQFYSPKPLKPDHINIADGTKITLRQIKRQRLSAGVKALRKRLARRFSVIGELHNFRVLMDNERVTVKDRGDYAVTQFLWNFKESDLNANEFPNVKEKKTLSNEVKGPHGNWRVSGWIGTAERPKQLDDSDSAGNLNTIVVFARGRLFHENILDKINDGRLYTKYLTGQIEADFLDDDDAADIATSDRQRIQEDDIRYTVLLEFLRSRLSEIEHDWTQWRRKHEIKKVQQTIPAIAEWIDQLPAGFQNHAERLIADLSALPIDNDEDRKLLYRHGIYAFERMRLRGSVDELTASVHNVDKLLTILADRDTLEAALYRDIIKSRLEAIKEFRKLTDENSKEKVLQKYLFDHLWLLDPAWERTAGSELMEDRLAKEGVIIADLDAKERLSRVDIAYRTNAGKHIIVELKRSQRSIQLLDLVGQGQKYVDKLKKILTVQNEQDPNIEVVFVLGKPLPEESTNPDRIKSSMDSISNGSRIKYYDGLIESALNAYSSYLEQSKELDKVERIVDQIE